MKIVKNPHDKFIRELLKDKEKAKGFLTGFLPKHILRLINLDEVDIV